MCLESKGNGLHVLERKGRGKLGGVRSSRGILYKEYFSNRELESLCGYRNRGSDQSLTYRYVLSPFYDVAIRLVPMWLAPNVVTLIGLMCVLASHLLAMVYVPHLTEDAPRWVRSIASLRWGVIRSVFSFPSFCLTCWMYGFDLPTRQLLLFRSIFCCGLACLAT